MLAVIQGRFGAVAGLCGAFLIAATTVIERMLVVPNLYDSAIDLLLHISAEIVAGALLWSCLWAGLQLALWAARLLPSEPRARRRIARGICLLLGLAAGFGLFLFVVRPSSRVASLPIPVWLALLSFVGCALSFSAFFLLNLRVPRRAGAVAVVLLGGALWMHLFALHRYLRHYGNLHSLVLVVTTVVAAVACGFLLHGLRAKFRKPLETAVAALLVACCLSLGFATPSFSARSAVLVWGGVAKRVLIAAAWPLLDRDGDGTPAVLWGIDPDDEDRLISALAPRRPPVGRETPLSIPKLSSKRNLVWIVVDTVRLDSFERVLAAGGGKSLQEFAYFAGYRSCSSRTGQVVSQLLGGDRCDRRTVEGLKGSSLLETLKVEGYHTHLVGYFDLPLPFATKEHLQHDDAVVARARELLAEPRTQTQAFVFHLKGGHQPYDGPGASERARYEANIDASFVRVAKILEAVPRDWAVVLLGDHGEEFGEHTSHAHATSLYQEVLRTPLLVRAPGFAAGRHQEALGCPSVPWKTLVAAGILEHEPDLLPFQYAALDIARGEFGYLRDSQLRSLEQNGTKVIWSPGLGIWELYDLKSDPGETRSLAAREPERLRKLAEKLTQLSLECGHLDPARHDD